MKSTNRRRLFGRAALFALLGGLAAGLGGAAWAYGGPGGHMGGSMGGSMGGGMGYGMMEERIERMLGRLAVYVNATPEQRSRLAEIAREAAKDLRPLRERALEARRRAAEPLWAQEIDRGAIERLRAEQMQAMDAVSRRMSEALAEAAEVLTPEQRKLAAEHFRHRPGAGAARGHGRG